MLAAGPLMLAAGPLRTGRGPPSRRSAAMRGA